MRHDETPDTPGIRLDFIPVKIAGPLALKNPPLKHIVPDQPPPDRHPPAPLAGPDGPFALRNPSSPGRLQPIPNQPRTPSRSSSPPSRHRFLPAGSAVQIRGEGRTEKNWRNAPRKIIHPWKNSDDLPNDGSGLETPRPSTTSGQLDGIILNSILNSPPVDNSKSSQHADLEGVK